MDRVPSIAPLRDPDIGFGLLPWARGPMWRLDEDHHFHIAVPGFDLFKYRIPSGYEFNKASIPALLWGPPWNYLPDGLCTVPALEHDFLCDLLEGGGWWLREQFGGALPNVPPARIVHEHFRLRLHAWGVRENKANAMGRAVAWFGPGGSLRPSSWF